MREPKFRPWVLLAGVLILANGVRILYEGRIRHVFLGNERYVAGGFAIVISLYIIYLSIYQKLDK